MSDKPHILIVDDNIGLCKTTAMILKYKGYDVTTAQDGAEALEKIKEQAFDMIFMDIKMPVMNGVETYKKIKQIKPEAVVMMMTAYAVEDLVEEALQQGAYGIIYKPLDIDKMLTTIEEARQARQGALILVVDDDPGDCFTLKSILSRQKYQVGIAHTGEEAIAAIQEKPYDIILIDMKLPTINGLETYLAIREISPETVAIIITGYRQEVTDLVEQALRNNAYTCLYKPFDIEELLRLIEGVWQKKSGGYQLKQRHL